ncbi:hypothetical protein JT358_15590 [Micrococcales bacterium 31B]|nr:hypothetical protein [Micrococcales bacterium 31B]
MSSPIRRARVATVAAAALVSLSVLAACTPLHAPDERLRQPSLSGADAKSILRESFTDVTGYHCTVTTAPKAAGTDFDVTVSNYSKSNPSSGSYEWVEDYLSHTVTSYWVGGRAYREAPNGDFGLYPTSFVDDRVTSDRFNWIANNLTFTVTQLEGTTTLSATSATPINREALIEAVLIDGSPRASTPEIQRALNSSIDVTATINLDSRGHLAAQSLTVTKVPQELEQLVVLDRRETCDSYNRVQPISAPSNTLPETVVPSGDSRV